MKYNGFTLVEVTFAFGLLLVLLLSILPIMMKVEIEDAILADRRRVTSILHDELLKEINTSNQNESFYSINDFTKIQLSFEEETDLLKGCASWINKQNQTEKVCLYGYPNN